MPACPLDLVEKIMDKEIALPVARKAPNITSEAIKKFLDMIGAGQGTAENLVKRLRDFGIIVVTREVWDARERQARYLADKLKVPVLKSLPEPANIDDIRRLKKEVDYWKAEAQRYAKNAEFHQREVSRLKTGVKNYGNAYLLMKDETPNWRR